MTDREVLIERLATTCLGLDAVDPLRLLVDDVIAALAQPEQEPVAWVNKERNTITWDKLYPDMDALYTTPPKGTK